MIECYDVDERNDTDLRDESFTLITVSSKYNKKEERLLEKNQSLQEEVEKLKNTCKLMSDRENSWKKKYINIIDKGTANERMSYDIHKEDLDTPPEGKNEKGNKEEKVSEVNISFLAETFNFAILDSGCTKTVCGKSWMNVYRQSLSLEENEKIDKSMVSSDRSFKFGDGLLSKSVGKVKVPAKLSGAKVLIETDIVEQEIPMLLSRQSMEKANTIINFKTEEVFMLGCKQTLIKTSTGHYCIPLTRMIVTEIASGPITTVLFTNNLCLDNEADVKKIAKKLHEQFGHPSSNRLIKLVKDGGIDNESLHLEIKEVEVRCEICQKYKKKPLRPVVCFPRARSFNENLAIDLKSYSPVHVLHIIDQFTRFSRTILINNKRAETVMSGVLEAWIAIFGTPKSILADNGGEFNNSEFRDLCDAFGITVYGTAAESPWSNGTNERHNGLLGQMIDKLLERGHTLKDATCWATSAKNSLANTEGYSPNQLLFGINPNYPSVLRNELPALEECSEGEYLFKILKAQQEAREEFVKAEASEKLKRAIKRKVRSHITSLPYEMGDKVYYMRKDKWKGPGVVVGKEHKDVLVKHGGSYFRVHPCSLQKVNESGKSTSDNNEMRNETTQKTTISQLNEREDKQEHISSNLRSSARDVVDTEDEEADESVSDNSVHTPTPQAEGTINVNGTRPNETETNNPGDVRGTCADITSEVDESWIHDKERKPTLKSLVNCKFKETDELKTYRVVSRAGKATGAHKNWFNVYDPADSNTKMLSVNWDCVEKWRTVPEEILINADNNDYEISEAKLVEIQKWSEFDVYTEVDNTGQNFMTVQWVISQTYENEKRCVKARLVARGFQEDSSMIRKDSPTTTRESPRLLLCFAESKHWIIHSLDIKSAFLQGSLLKREVYIKPPAEANTKKLWKLNKCVYGLTDASRMWYLKVDKAFRDMGLEKMTLDEAFYVYKINKTVKGMACIHVDDILWTGDKDFEDNVIAKIKKQFKVSKETEREFIHLGLCIKQGDNGTTIDQKHYINSLEDPPIELSNRNKDEKLTKDECKIFKSFIGQLSWASALSRPDIAFETCVGGVGVESSCISDVIKARKTLRKLKQSHLIIKYVPLLNIENCSIELYTDASFANLKDSASQAGFLIFLLDKERNANIIKWQSKKISRVVKSTLAAEALALLDGAENAYYIKRLMEDILGKDTDINVHCISDNKSLVDSVYSTKSLADYRLRIDMGCLRSMVNNKELTSVRWIKTQDQLADCLTKQGASCHNLLNVLSSNSIKF